MSDGERGGVACVDSVVGWAGGGVGAVEVQVAFCGYSVRYDSFGSIYNVDAPI